MKFMFSESVISLYISTFRNMTNDSHFPKSLKLYLEIIKKLSEIIYFVVKDRKVLVIHLEDLRKPRLVVEQH